MVRSGIQLAVNEAVLSALTRTRVVRAACLLLAGAFACNAWAQAFPSKPVRIIVPYSTGSSIDQIARLVGQIVAGTWGQSVVIENQVSASGISGTAAVVKSPPDGYTLLAVAINHAINPSLYKEIPYDTLRDLKPVVRMATVPLVVVAQPGFPANSIAETIALAKSKPGTLFYGSSGSGSSLHLAFEMLKTRAGVDITHVPYKSVAGLMTDLLGGRMALASPVVALVQPHVAAGKLKALAVTSGRRSSLMPDVPTMTEAGFQDFDVSAWSGLYAPAGTPDDVIAKVHADVASAIQSRAFTDVMNKQGVEPYLMNPAEFRNFTAAEVAKWAKIVKDSGAKVD
jgi:tripartite-type tricarboxylate transporter receptor subunit TctC